MDVMISNSSRSFTRPHLEDIEQVYALNLGLILRQGPGYNEQIQYKKLMLTTIGSEKPVRVCLIPILFSTDYSSYYLAYKDQSPDDSSQTCPSFLFFQPGKKEDKEKSGGKKKKRYTERLSVRVYRNETNGRAEPDECFCHLEKARRVVDAPVDVWNPFAKHK
jgi:hypothetical protein